MAERMGFKGELPRNLRRNRLLPGTHARESCRQNGVDNTVELDSLTGKMQGLLYPGAKTNVQGFQDYQAPPNFFDLIASNVPFGDYGVHDPKYNKFDANIHDYFFLKSMDLREGGLVMHITSTGTMDKGNSKIREELAKKGDLVAAIRFPGGAHKENAGTEVVTDMLILRSARRAKHRAIRAGSTQPWFPIRAAASRFRSISISPIIPSKSWARWTAPARCTRVSR